MLNRFIRRLERHGDLEVDDVAALVSATSNGRMIAAKTVLIREGDRPGPVFVFLEGWAIRYKILPTGTRQILAVLMPGDYCDLHSDLLAEMDHGIQTITAAKVASLSGAAIDVIMAERPKVARALYVARLADEGVLRAWITSMGRRSSIERVAHLMCEFYLRAIDIGLPTDPALALPLSQLLLADILGMTPVHLNRILKELKACEAMRLQRGKLLIIDPTKLARIAGFDENYLHRRSRLG